jgi:hypothetical protein
MQSQPLLQVVKESILGQYTCTFISTKDVARWQEAVVDMEVFFLNRK